MATTPKKPRKPQHHRGVSVSVWTMNGGPIPDEAVERIQGAVEATIVALFNEEDLRLLTQTNKG